MMEYTYAQLAFIFILYSFLGWCGETIVCSVLRRRLINAGFLTLPFILTCGFVMVLLVGALPSTGTNLPVQFVMTLVISAVVHRLKNFNLQKLCPDVKWTNQSGLFEGKWGGVIRALLTAAVYYTVYLVLHPLILFLILWIPFLNIIDLVGLALIGLDLVFTIIAVRRGTYKEVSETGTGTRVAEKLTGRFWDRIQKSYPGVREMDSETEREAYTFAGGMTLDKLVWIFLISALLGDLIETVWVRMVSHIWMSRSSLLYGTFSLVWGIGAVILTIVLSPLAKKDDRWIFLGGAFIGGAYEYLCSVFTEIVFGTVFWDYSHMPLNINGRTNVLFMFFWGILSVVWLKMIYPGLSGMIERIPPVEGKLITWAVIVVMVLDAGLTAMAMVRYNIRHKNPAQHSQYDVFMDTHFPDSLMEERWPNMRITGKN